MQHALKVEFDKDVRQPRLMRLRAYDTAERRTNTTSSTRTLKMFAINDEWHKGSSQVQRGRRDLPPRLLPAASAGSTGCAAGARGPGRVALSAPPGEGLRGARRGAIPPPVCALAALLITGRAPLSLACALHDITSVFRVRACDWLVHRVIRYCYLAVSLVLPVIILFAAG